MNISKILSVLAAVSLMFVFAGCGGSNSTPEGAAKAMTEAMFDKNVDKVVSLMHIDTEGTGMSRKELEDMIKPKMKAGFAQKDAEIKEKGGFKSVETELISQKDDSARVKTTIHFKDGTQGTQPMNLKRVDGKWFVLIN